MYQHILPLLFAAGALAPGATSSAATAAAPITVEVGYPERGQSFLDVLLEDDEDTDRSDREVEQALRGRRWLELVSHDGEVALAVTRRSVSESSRSRDKKKGTVTVSWRYVLRAAISMRGQRDWLEASTVSSFTVSAGEASHVRHRRHGDNGPFSNLAREIAEDADEWVLAHLDDLRPERPDPGLRHELKRKWLLKGDGLEVTEVLPGSPAARAGLLTGDRIRAIDGEKGTAKMDKRAKTWWSEEPGTLVTLEVERNKRKYRLGFPILWPRDWRH